MDESIDQVQDSQDQDQDQDQDQELALETPPEHVFMAPSIHVAKIYHGDSYSYMSPVPELIKADMSTECVLGVDEAGRGPVLGPMVYGLCYLPLSMHHSLLADTHHFDDSKVLTPAVRSSLMQAICTPDTDLYKSCGWATRVMSAQDISSAQMRPTATYNLNAQAMDATIDLIHAVFALGVNLKEIYIDTIGQPATYQKKLGRIFPTVNITVAKKADSLYPAVSAASVCAKVTRDAALDVCYSAYKDAVSSHKDIPDVPAESWGSGYPSDPRCSAWLKKNMDPLFGWGNECRFSWATVKEPLEAKPAVKVNWPVPGDDDSTKLTNFFMYAADDAQADGQLSTWYGRRVTEDVF